MLRGALTFLVRLADIAAVLLLLVAIKAGVKNVFTIPIVAMFARARAGDGPPLFN